MFQTIIGHLPVNLVGEDGDIRPPLKTLHEFVYFRPRGHAARWIGRAVQNYKPGRRRDPFEQIIGAKRKIVFLVYGKGNRGRFRIIDHRTVYGKAGIGTDDLRSGLGEHQDGEKHRRLAARHNDNAIRIDLNAKPAMDVRRDGFPQGSDTHSGRIAVMAVPQRLDGGVDYMRRRGEIRLADPEIDDIAPLGNKFGGARQHGKGVLVAEP